MVEYKDRNVGDLDERGGYYTAHLDALKNTPTMSKKRLAEELAHRDLIIDELKAALTADDPSARPAVNLACVQARTLHAFADTIQKVVTDTPYTPESLVLFYEGIEYALDQARLTASYIVKRSEEGTTQ